jgi:hypothetical protein
MTNTTRTRPAEGDAVLVEPTALLRAVPGAIDAAVTEKAGRGRALIVFRSEGEAEKYRSATGNNPEAEGWRTVPLEPWQLSDVLAMQGCTHVAMPEEWTGKGGVDVLAAEAFVRMLEEAPPA